MLVYKKRIQKLAQHTLLALVLLQVLIAPSPIEAATKCHQCTGINCQRTSYAATEDCADALDSCVSVFQGSMVLAQGCLGQLDVELRNKCEISNAEETDETEVVDASDGAPAVNSDCHQCREDLCNNVGSEGTDCIECDSNEDAKCASDTDNLQPQRCPLSRAMNTYCYAKIEGNRATRGCAIDLALQRECLSNNDCSLCSPSDIGGCNRDPKVTTDDSSSGGSSSSGSDSGSGSGSNSGGSSSGGGNGGSDSGAGSGSGTGDGGSSSGGSSSGTSDGGSNSGGSNGGSDSGAGSSSGTNDGGSSSGGSSSGGDSGSTNGGAGTGTSDGGSNSGGSNGGSDSGAGSGTGTGGGDSSSGGGNGSSDNGSSNNGSGSVTGTSNKLFVALMLMILQCFIKF